jgi:hypothetical protein
MKKLSKLQIKPERLLKNEELMTINGGGDYIWVWCMNATGTCGNWPRNECDYEAWLWCESVCPDLTYVKCY